MDNQANTTEQDTETTPLDVFAQNILIEKGVADLDADLVAGMKQDIMERLELLVNKVTLNALSDDDLDAFDKMIDDGASQEELQKFTEEHVPDLPQRLSEALERFRLMYLGTIA